MKLETIEDVMERLVERMSFDSLSDGTYAENPSIEDIREVRSWLEDIYEQGRKDGYREACLDD